MIHPLARTWLTVLAYHRVADVTDPDLLGLPSTVSASAKGFAEQCRFVNRWFTVISYHRLSCWLRGEGELPPWPALVTFDDGYRDNFTTALPILRQMEMPSMLFLATDHLQGGMPFYWDLAAYCFQHAPAITLSLPLLGKVSLAEPHRRQHFLKKWLATAKNVTEAEKADAVHQLPAAMRVNISWDRFSELTMTWAEASLLPREGMTLGAHTRSHPILSKLPLNEALDEIGGSREDIETRIGQKVVSFAYPNGGRADFSDRLEEGIKELGFESAFTLIPGASSFHAIRRRPMAIRRIMISHKDNLSRFAVKLMSGVPELLNTLRTLRSTPAR